MCVMMQLQWQAATHIIRKLQGLEMILVQILLYSGPRSTSIKKNKLMMMGELIVVLVGRCTTSDKLVTMILVTRQPVCV